MNQLRLRYVIMSALNIWSLFHKSAAYKQIANGDTFVGHGHGKAVDFSFFCVCDENYEETK